MSEKQIILSHFTRGGKKMDFRKSIGTFYLLTLLIFGVSSNAQAASVQSADTEGTIQFSGRYEPIGIPDPPPDIAKPPKAEQLPQTNTLSQNHWLWFGWLFVVVAGSLGVKRNTKNKKMAK
jgi:hypothetical protein